MSRSPARGGSHTAFTAGVLKRLFDSGDMARYDLREHAACAVCMDLSATPRRRRFVTPVPADPIRAQADDAANLTCTAA